MPKFLIEVPHDAEQLACARVVQVFLATGSHFLTNADWGCGDGVHTAWIMVDVGSEARIVELNRFSMAQIEPILRRHAASGGGEASSVG